MRGHCRVVFGKNNVAISRGLDIFINFAEARGLCAGMVCNDLYLSKWLQVLDLDKNTF